MGKKSRAVPGRRPILQLSPPGPRSSTPGRDPEPEPDTEPDTTAAATSQPAPAAVAAAAPQTTTVVTTAAAPDDSPSEGKRARGPLGGTSETRARSLGPRPLEHVPEEEEKPGLVAFVSEACRTGPVGRTAVGP